MYLHNATHTRERHKIGETSHEIDTGYWKLHHTQIATYTMDTSKPLKSLQIRLILALRARRYGD